MSLILLSASLLVLGGAPLNHGLSAANGVDLFRGCWAGKMVLPDSTERQINFYLNAAAPESGIPNALQASGYFSHDPVDGQKRAKAPHLPMMARILEHADHSFEIVMLATFTIPPEFGSFTTIVKFIGQGSLGNSGVTDDKIAGTWYLTLADGNAVSSRWSAVHLDRRNIEAPTVNLDDPTLYFGGDVYANLEGSLANRGEGTIIGAFGNIVMASVRVTAPDGSYVVLPQYTDIFSPSVDWTTLFRFTTWRQGLPVAGGRYVFQALDVAGNPIPGVEASDVWVGVPPPNPPSGVLGSATDTGILVTWDEVPTVPGSFEPAVGLGFYQLELSGPSGMVFGANGIGSSPHLIPSAHGDFVPGQDWGLALSELANGTYTLRTCVHSVAPAGSAGHGFEYNNADPGEQIVLTILDGVVSLK